MLRIGSKSNKHRNKKRHHFRFQTSRKVREGGGRKVDMALGAIMQAGVSQSLSLLKARPLHWNGTEIFYCPDRVNGEYIFHSVPVHEHLVDATLHPLSLNAYSFKNTNPNMAGKRATLLFECEHHEQMPCHLSSPSS